MIGSIHDDRVYAPEYIKFLLHPYVKNIVWNGSAEPTRILAHTMEEYLTETRALTFVTLGELESDRTLCAEAAVRLSHAGFAMSVDDVAAQIALLHAQTMGALWE